MAAAFVAFRILYFWLAWNKEDSFAHHDKISADYESREELMLEIPRLNTDRLLMRGFTPDDFEAYAEMMSDAEVARFLMDGRALSRAEAWRQLAMFIGHWTLRGFGLWAVEERATGKFIGRIGCLQPEGFPAFEIAYALARPAWGQGYAREGAAAALGYARTTLKRTKIASIIRPANTPSIRVAESLGAVAGNAVDFFGAPSV